MVRSPADVIKCLGGTAKPVDILRLTSRSALRCAEARGDVLRLSRGVYALPDALPDLRAAAAVHGVLSHRSAAAYWLMEQLSADSSLHVTVPRNNRPTPRKGMTLHYADQVDEIVTSPLRTVLDCARTLPFPEALAIADSACRRELTDVDELLAAARRLRGPGRQRILRVVEHADPRADNAFESGMRGIVIEAGISGFEPQLIIPGPNPTIRVDLGDPVRRIALEADSFAFHASRAELARDCHRYTELARHDWLLLRFAWEDVMFHQDWVATTALQTCALRDATATGARISPR
jgi:hypothetical protein